LSDIVASREAFARKPATLAFKEDEMVMAEPFWIGDHTFSLA
jgi:hypothetical protein